MPTSPTGMSVATLVGGPAGVRPWVPPPSGIRIPSPVTFSGSGGTPLGQLMQIAPGADLSQPPVTWAWVTLPGVRWDAGVTVVRGVPEGQPGAPCTMEFVVDNRSGNLTEDNPYGIWFGLISSETPVRHILNPGSGPSIRFTGFLTDLPQSRDSTGANRYIRVSAKDTRGRVSIGTTAPQTATVTAAATVATVDTTLIGSWPMTDKTTATSAASAIAGAAAGAVGGTVHFGVTVGPDGVTKYPDLLDGGEIVCTVPSTSVTTEWSVQAIIKPRSTHSTSNFPMAVSTASGTAPLWLLRYDNAGTILVQWEDPDTGVDTTVVTSALTPWDNAWHTMRISCKQNGANVDVVLYRDGVSIGTGTQAGKTIGRPYRATAGDQGDDDIASVALLSVYNSAAAPTAATVAVTTGNVGQNAAERLATLCAANSVPYATLVTDAVAMGAQTEDAFFTQVEQVEAADSGIVITTRDGLLALYGHTLRENRNPDMTIDHAVTRLRAFEWTLTNPRPRNDVTANRTGGGSARVTVSEPSRGVQPDSVTVNVATDAQLFDQAAVRVQRGTNRDRRITLVKINLAADPSLIPAAMALDVYNRLDILNPPRDGVTPAWPVGRLSLTVQQITEFSNSRQWEMSFATTPYALDRIAVATSDSGDTGEYMGHADWDSCVVATAAVAPTATSIAITTAPLMTTTADDFLGTPGLQIIVRGERMKITNCVGASNPQTLTVIRSLADAYDAVGGTGVVQQTDIPVGTPIVLAPESACYLSL